MPEGDTIHRAANRLASALAGRPLTGFEAPRLVADGPEPGTVIDRVEAHGKFLLVHFDDGTTLETHLKMTGSWHLYRAGERWRRSPRAARAVVRTEDWVGVCFDAPHVRLVRTASRRSEGHRAHLGPDLTAADPDLDEALRRLDDPEHRRRPVVDVLLDQRLFCGVGNVFKSEVLHACGLHPDVALGAVDPAARRRLLDTAHRQLRSNLGRGERRTVPQGLAVYGRDGRPCHRCDAVVVAERRGRHHRITYWCPACQPAPEA